MSPTPTFPLTSRALARLQDESGIALVMALGIMLVLTIVLTSTIYFTSASLRHANGSNAGQKSYAIAEAGLNDAVAQLVKYYPPYASPISIDAGAGSLITSGGDKPFPGGLVSWTGTFNAGIWTLTGTGKVANPTGGSQIVRTAKAIVKVNSGLPLAYKYGFFMGDPTKTSVIDNGGAASLSVYVAGSLIMADPSKGTGNSGIVEPPPGTPPTLDLYVGGLLDMGDKGSSHVGTSISPIRSAVVVGGCKKKVTTICSVGSSSQVWAAAYGSTPNPQPLPTADPDVVYATANPSAATCTSGSQPFDNIPGRNSSKGTVDLLSLAKFDCSTPAGHLAWDPASESLTASGTIFIDGNLVIGPGGKQALYTAGTSATIYVNGTVVFKNDGAICGPSLPPPAAQSSAVDPCLDRWDPTQGELMIWSLNSDGVDPAVDVGGNASFEGGLYANGKYFGHNGASVKGPVLGKYGEIDGDGKSKAFITLPGGAPSDAFTLGLLEHYG